MDLSCIVFSQVISKKCACSENYNEQCIYNAALNFYKIFNPYTIFGWISQIRRITLTVR